MGYIQAAPDLEDHLSPRAGRRSEAALQGWAIVENTSEEDWNNVDLTLVSGRPISFTMDLYQPLYVPRPEVQLELYSSLLPQIYRAGLGPQGTGVCGPVRTGRKRNRRSESLRPAGGTEYRRDAPAELCVCARGAADDLRPSTLHGDVVAGGPASQSAAQAANVGNLFQYVIATPVSLPRQQSAMLPIANADVKGEKLDIYNAAVQAKHPLYGLRFTNTTDLYLMQGPITVFDGGVYAGDARIEDLPPGGERLISYGIDLDTEVAPRDEEPARGIAQRPSAQGHDVHRPQVRAVAGVHGEELGQEGEDRVGRVSDRRRLEAGFAREADRKDPRLYRFAVEAKPGEPAKLTVDEERTERQQIALTNMDDNTIQFYQSAKVVSEKVKAALAEIVKRKHELQQVAADRQQREQRIRQIAEDQNRVRQNMDRLDRTSELYKSYVKKFTKQEEEVVKLNEEIASLTEQEADLRKSLDEYMMGLDLQ